jgi:molybdopterin synthase catalytic subunit
VIDVRIQAGDFDPGAQLRRLGSLHCAGVASFTGMLSAEDGVTEIVVEHYAVLAKRELAGIAEEAEARWPLSGLVLIHRHGRMKPEDRILFAAAASADPSAAVEACAFLADALRDRAPFWRKDKLADGSFRWR